MATIGSFTASGNGFNGTIKTLNLNVKAMIRAGRDAPPKRSATSASSPAMSSSAPPGRRPPNEGRDYLSVKLDDPSFPAPIYATLIEVQGEEGLLLHLVPAEPDR